MLGYSYSDEQKLLRENIRKWGKEHLPEEKIAEAYRTAASTLLSLSLG